LEFEITEKNDGININIKSKKEEDESCQYLVNQKFDRYFFLISAKICADYIAVF